MGELARIKNTDPQKTFLLSRFLLLSIRKIRSDLWIRRSYHLFLVALFLGSSMLSSGQYPAYGQVEKAPPYENRLLRLSQIIGSVHFLTLLCRPDDGLVWHNKMTEMIDAEATTQLRRAKLVERFNSGFTGFQATYRKCTPAAETALERYIAEAQVIVQNLTTDFSG